MAGGHISGLSAQAICSARMVKESKIVCGASNYGEDSMPDGKSAYFFLVV